MGGGISKMGLIKGFLLIFLSVTLAGLHFIFTFLKIIIDALEIIIEFLLKVVLNIAESSDGS